jgi:membrane protein YqaA with SNARE-associated domain
MAYVFNRTTLIALGLVLIIIGWTWLLITVGSEAVVAYIGAENGYLVMFLMALFGGVSSVTGVAYVATIITLASAGLNPALLALASGLGISIGDTIYYLIGRFGLRELALSRFEEHVRSFTAWLFAKPAWLRALGIYLYTGFTPLPNDILTILLGVARQPYAVVLPALILGNATLTYLIATFGSSLSFLA